MVTGDDDPPPSGPGNPKRWPPFLPLRPKEGDPEYPSTTPQRPPGYWDGVKDGLKDCGESVRVMFQAFLAMSRGHFEKAAQLLGATDSGAGGVYDANGAPGYTNELAGELNCHFVDRAIQHGPQDTWALRNDPKMGSNYGPQVGNGKAVTAYLPDGRTFHLETLEQMRAFYQSIGVDWSRLYPGF